MLFFYLKIAMAQNNSIS